MLSGFLSSELSDKYEHRLILLAAVLSGIAQPGNSLGVLSLISYVPFFYVLVFSQQKTVKHFAWIGYKFGFFFSLVALYWISFSDVGGFIGTQVTIALRFSILAIVALLFQRFKIPFFALIPFFIVHEFAYTIPDLDFPWYMAGYALTDIPILLQVTEYTGIYGISFFVYLCNYFIFVAVATKMPPSGKRLLPFGVCVAVFVAINLTIYALVDTSNGRSVKVGVVQPNIDPFLKWDNKFRSLSIDRLFAGTYKNILGGADHIVWPETAMPYRLRRSPQMINTLQTLAADQDVNIVVGAIDSRRVAGKRKSFNSVFHFLHTEEKYQIYDKRRLVPVIEKRIFEGVFDFINNLPGMAGFELGEKNLVLNSHNKFYNTEFDGISGTWKTDTLRAPKIEKLNFATTVCIESNYPELYREFNTEKPVDLFNVITNDGWFYPHYAWFKSFANWAGFSPYLKGKAAVQHQRIAQVRAVETRTSIVRAANTGVSSVIDPFGFVISWLDQYEEGNIVAYAPILEKEPTFYQKNGDWFLTLCGALVLICGISSRVRPLRREPQPL